MNKLILIISLIVTFCTVKGQSDEKVLLNKGLEAYRQGNFSTALDLFNDSYTANGDYNKSVFNAAHVALLNDSIAIAKDLLSEYISISEGKLNKSKGHYNLGNIQYKEYEKLAENPEESQQSIKVLKESIESFKKAVRNNPKDTDARHNLSLAMSKVPPPSENQDQQDNKDNQDQQDENQENKDQKDQQKDGEGQDKNDQQNKDGEKGEDGDKGEKDKEGDKGDQPGEQKEGDKGDEEQKGSQGKEGDEKGEEEMKGKISRMQATKDLDAMNNEEQKTLMKVSRKKGGENKQNNSSKDW